MDANNKHVPNQSGNFFSNLELKKKSSLSHFVPINICVTRAEVMPRSVKVHDLHVGGLNSIPSIS